MWYDAFSDLPDRIQRELEMGKVGLPRIIDGRWVISVRQDMANCFWQIDDLLDNDHELAPVRDHNG